MKTTYHHSTNIHIPRRYIHKSENDGRRTYRPERRQCKGCDDRGTQRLGSEWAEVNKWTRVTMGMPISVIERRTVQNGESEKVNECEGAGMKWLMMFCLWYSMYPCSRSLCQQVIMSSWWTWHGTSRCALMTFTASSCDALVMHLCSCYTPLPPSFHPMCVYVVHPLCTLCVTATFHANFFSPFSLALSVLVNHTSMTSLGLTWAGTTRPLCPVVHPSTHLHFLHLSHLTPYNTSGDHQPPPNMHQNAFIHPAAYFSTLLCDAEAFSFSTPN